MKQNYPEQPIILFTGLCHDDGAILTTLREGAYRYARKGSQAESLKAVQMAFSER